MCVAALGSPRQARRLSTSPALRRAWSSVSLMRPIVDCILRGNCMVILMHLGLLGLLAGDGDVSDQVMLKDGRTLEGKINEREDGMYLVMQNGTVKIPDVAVQETCLGNVDAYQPKDDFEREQMKKGMVRFQGTWMSKGRR